MLTKDIYKETTGYFLKPVLPLLNDDDVTEIMINGPNVVFVERKGRIYPAGPDVCFKSEHALMSAAQNIAEYVGRRLDRDSHSLDGRLPAGHRVHVIIPPSARNGITITIRKFRESRLTLDDLITYESITEAVKEYLNICVLLHKNIVVSGGTGTGKTSLLNALSRCIPETERIVVIEDTSELKLFQPHTVYLEAQPPRPDGRGQVTIRDLFVDSLRMRPDRIIVGEVRRGEALDLIQAMISGHAGSITTVHANTPRDAAIRLETLCLMSDVELPQVVARTQVASAIDVVVQLQRFQDGSRRVSCVSEAEGVVDGSYSFVDIFRIDGPGGGLLPTGRQSVNAEQLKQQQMQHLVRLNSDVFGLAN